MASEKAGQKDMAELVKSAWHDDVVAAIKEAEVKDPSIGGQGDMAEFRKFETGATRDSDTNKHDPEGFISPLVIDRFNEYMHANRLQKDGSIRDSDNWQKGIPKTAYMKSMWRHFHDVWLHHRGYSNKAKEPLEIALCGLLFNVMGMLDVTLKGQHQGQPQPNSPLG